jgi:hypothetical protein
MTHGYTWHATIDALLDRVLAAEAANRAAHAELLQLADSMPSICDNAHYRAARLTLVPTPDPIREEPQNVH